MNHANVQLANFSVLLFRWEHCQLILNRLLLFVFYVWINRHKRLALIFIMVLMVPRQIWFEKLHWISWERLLLSKSTLGHDVSVGSLMKGGSLPDVLFVMSSLRKAIHLRVFFFWIIIVKIHKLSPFSFLGFKTFSMSHTNSKSVKICWYWYLVKIRRMVKIADFKIHFLIETDNRQHMQCWNKFDNPIIESLTVQHVKNYWSRL